MELRKTLVKIVAIPLALILVANGAAAISDTVSDAIQGLPLGEQITFLANEIDEIKETQRRLICDEVTEIEEEIVGVTRTIEAAQQNIAASSSQGKIEFFMRFIEKAESELPELRNKIDTLTREGTIICP